MDFLDAPEEMTPEARLTEVAAIMAAGYLRLRPAAIRYAGCAGTRLPAVHRESSGLFWRTDALVERRVDGPRTSTLGGHTMKADISKQVGALRDLTLAELRERYQEVFGEPTTSRHKIHLQKRIAWRLQANAEGGLSDRALRRAEELANEADLRMLAPSGDSRDGVGRTVVRSFKPSQDRRLPMPGTVITREYKGRTIRVTVLDQGFEYEGTVYRSLTAVARAVTGMHWNGFHFFRDAIGGSRR